ncbi:unnamed protein product, partial [Mesorhabditis spiculigera]
MAGASQAYQIAGWLEKMDSPDKDFRFMAISDLMGELNKTIARLDEDAEIKVVRKLLKLLEDRSGEVQNLAVRCLGVLVQRCRDPQAETVADALCQNLASNKPDVRDVSSVALKTVVTELHTDRIGAVGMVRRITPQLANFLNQDNVDSPIRMEMLEVLGDILLRFGQTITEHHSQIRDVLLTILSSERPAIRKRAIIALGNLTASCNPTIFDEICAVLFERLQNTGNESVVRGMATSIAYVTKASAVVPTLLKACRASDDDDLKEAVLQCFEVFILRCPEEIAPFIDELESLSITYIAHDPNFIDDDDDQMEANDDDEEEEDISDDDDMSWKIRRAAAKVIEALVCSRRERMLHSINTYAPILIGRLKEREENVRTDIFGAAVTLLRQIGTFIPSPLNCLAHFGDARLVIGKTAWLADSLSDEQIELIKALYAQVPGIVRTVGRLLKHRSPRTRLDCFALLSALVRTLPGALTEHFVNVLQPIATMCAQKTTTSQMKIDAIQFLSITFKSHPPALIAPHLPTITRIVINGIEDSFYKVTSEALGVLDQLIPLMADHSDNMLISQLSHATYPRIKASDLDQEVKERAIIAAGLFISQCGDAIPELIPDLLEVLVDRCRNELTRIYALRSLDAVVQSLLNITFPSSMFSSLLPLLAEFLRKNIRALKIASLKLLGSILVRFDDSMLADDVMTTVLHEVVNAMEDDDLLVTQNSFKCLALAFAKCPRSTTPYITQAISKYGALLKSAYLQGVLLNSGLEMISALCENEIPGKPQFEDLLDQITAPVYDNVQLPRQAYSAISATTATVAAASHDEEKAVHLALKLREQLGNRASTDGIRLFSLLTLGELGRQCSSIYTSDAIGVEVLIMEAFKSQNEDLKNAASNALGGMAVGNLPKFLPFILTQMQESNRQYLLLHSIKEIILCETQSKSSRDGFQQYIPKIWPVLFEHAEANEESTRNIVAECIGKLCILEPSLLKDLKVHLHAESANVRAVVATAIKYMISPERQSIDTHLQVIMPDFVTILSDPDLDVRRLALIALNSAAHNKRSLIRAHLAAVLPKVYTETKIRKELIVEVEMGPFKHLVDEGLDLRKAAFECLYTILGTCTDKLDIFEVINYMEEGMKDAHDIRLLTYLTLIKLSTLTPTHVLQRLDRICEHIKAQLALKSKVNAVKQELDKHEELRRSAIRTLMALKEMPDASRHPQLSEVFNFIHGNAELRELHKAIEKNVQRICPDGI